jgi:hypothetical protein
MREQLITYLDGEVRFQSPEVQAMWKAVREGKVSEQFLAHFLTVVRDNKVSIPVKSKEPDLEIGIGEASHMLKEQGIDLRAEVQAQARSHIRWGLHAALVKGEHASATLDAYLESLNQVQFSCNGIGQALAVKEQGSRYCGMSALSVVVDPGYLLPQELFDVLFSHQIQRKSDSWGQTHLNELRIIKPDDIPESLKTFEWQGAYETEFAFQQAFQRVADFPVPRPRVMLTAKVTDNDAARASDLYGMQAIADGDVEYLDFRGQMLKLRLDMDRALWPNAKDRERLDAIIDPRNYRNVLRSRLKDTYLEHFFEDTEYGSPLNVFVSGLLPHLSFAKSSRRVSVLAIPYGCRNRRESSRLLSFGEVKP